LALKHGAGFNGLGNQGGPLVKNSAAAHGVVTNFAVPHVLIRGKAHRLAVSFEFCMAAFGFYRIQIIHFGVHYRVPLFIISVTYAIHNEQYYRTLPSFPGGIFF
jgi:hypothetical protein